MFKFFIIINVFTYQSYKVSNLILSLYVLLNYKFLCKQPLSLRNYNLHKPRRIRTLICQMNKYLLILSLSSQMYQSIILSHPVKRSPNLLIIKVKLNNYKFLEPVVVDWMLLTKLAFTKIRKKIIYFIFNYYECIFNKNFKYF